MHRAFWRRPAAACASERAGLCRSHPGRERSRARPAATTAAQQQWARDALAAVHADVRGPLSPFRTPHTARDSSWRARRAWEDLFRHLNSLSADLMSVHKTSGTVAGLATVWQNAMHFSPEAQLT